MQQCHTCGNHYDKMLEIKYLNKAYHFDCFECAIHSLAPNCKTCGCKIIGHGLECNNEFFCCVHCSKHAGIAELKDHV